MKQNSIHGSKHIIPPICALIDNKNWHVSVSFPFPCWQLSNLDRLLCNSNVRKNLWVDFKLPSHLCSARYLLGVITGPLFFSPNRQWSLIRYSVSRTKITSVFIGLSAFQPAFQLNSILQSSFCVGSQTNNIKFASLQSKLPKNSSDWVQIRDGLV